MQNYEELGLTSWKIFAIFVKYSQIIRIHML